MNVKYGVRYTDGYHSYYMSPMADSSKWCFKEKSELIEYINCLCIAMNGKLFALHDRFPFETGRYKSNFWNTKLIPSNSRRILSAEDLNYHDGEKWRNWPQYLNEINTMPDGISVSATPEEKSILDYSRQGDGMTYTRYMDVTFLISDEYAQRVNDARVRFSKHNDLLEVLLKGVPFYLAGKEKKTIDIDVGRTGVHLGSLWGTTPLSTRYFSEFQLKPLANKFECFVFANVLHDYIVEKEKKNLVFYDGTIELAHNVAISVIGSEPTYVRLTICFSEKNEKANLNSW